MARAHSVWVVCSKDRQPLATFTVKHECITWLKNYKHKGNLLNNRPHWVCRFSDGRFDPTIPVWSVLEFILE